MADIVTDIANIQDEDQLRRMWSNTEDFAKKKEIRVRLYKLRESRLKNIYTSDDSSNVSVRSSSNIIQETNRKHTATKTHMDSIQDQGYMTLKSKEIRDSESPTRDINGKIIRNDSYNNKSYDIKLMDNNTVVLPNSQDWTTSQTANYTTNTEGNTVTEFAERQSSAVLARDNENITLKAQEAQAFSSTDNSKDGVIDKSTKLQESTDLVQNSSYKDDNTSFQAVSKQKQDTSVSSSVKQVGNVTSYSTSSRTVSSKSSSSKTVMSSSKIISGKNLEAIDSGEDFVDKLLSIKQNEIDDEVKSNLNYDTKRRNSKIDRTVRKRSSTASLSDVIQKRNSLTTEQIQNVNESDYNIDNTDSTNIRSSKIIENRSDSSSNIRSSKIIENQSESSSNVLTSKTVQDSTDVNDYDYTSRQNLKNAQTTVNRNDVTDDSQTYVKKSSYDTSSKFVDNENIVDSTKIDTVESDTSSIKDRKDVSDAKVYNSRKDIKTSHLTNINTSSTTENRNVDQNIMTELNNLDSYLSTHPTSTPVSPRSVVTDTDYQDVRRTPVKHPSTLDLPKESTDGQYLTTYNDSYKNRISTNYDVSPTHNAFASSLRADTPERSPSSPTRSFSTDRKSPRASPEKYNPRSASENRYRKSPEKTPTRDSPNRGLKSSPERSPVRSSPDRYQTRKSPEKTPTRDSFARKSPEKTPTRSSPNPTRGSPSKSPVDSHFGKQPTATSPNRRSPERAYNRLDKDTDATRKVQDRRLSSSSYTVETKKDTNKSKRKFSSAQSKDAAKKRISTPKVSPDTSPTRNGNTSDTSDDSQGTYNTSSRKTQDVTRNDVQDSYSTTQETYTKTSEYTRSDSKDTYNKYRRDSADTYDKDTTDRNESRNSYTIDSEEDVHEYERSDSTDSFNVKKLRKDSKDITKQELKQRKLLSESENENVRTTRTNDFIRTEINENIQQNHYKSPSVSPVRQKSPEYSSEGSITKEIKLTNSLTDKNLILIEQAEEINIDIKDSNQTSASVTPCTSPDSNAPRRPSILKKKTTDNQITQESKTQQSTFESYKTPQQSPVKSRPTSPEKSFIKDELVQKTTERKSSILKSSKVENKENTYDTKTVDRKDSILKSPVKKEKSPERNVKTNSHIIKDEYEILVSEQSRKSPVRDRQSPTRGKKSPSPTKSPRESPTRNVVPFESRLTSPTQASLIREQKISETFDLTIKERRSPTKSPTREETPRQASPHKSPIRDAKSPEKQRKTPVREKASPQRAPSKPVEKRPSRQSNIPRAESLRSIKRPTSTTPSGTRQQTPKVTPPSPKVTPPTPKVTPSKTPSQRSLTPQQSRSAIKTTPKKVPVTTRTNSANITKASTLVKTNSYSARRATEPVKQAKPSTPVVTTKIPAKAPVKQAPKISKQPVKKVPVKSPKTTKELKANTTKKQTKTTINIEEEIRASNKTLEDILSREQHNYDSEIESEVPPEEFLVEEFLDDEEECELSESRTESKSFFTNKQDHIRKEIDHEDSSSDDEIENIKITKSKRVDESRTNKQNEDLLSVVVQLPNSSRESTPGVKNTGVQQVPYSSDINQPARYADYYSEPETDNERTIKSVETSQYEQVTDLDEETIDLLNVSVADRVNKFLSSTRTDVDKENTQTVIEKKSVSQAKNMFENIAKSQSSPSYNENLMKTPVKPLSSRPQVEEELCETKSYYEVNHNEKRTTNDFINIEKEVISQDDQTKKSPKDIYLEKTVRSSTPTVKPAKGAQPQKKVFDDTYYIEKNKRKLEEIEQINLNKTTIDSCDEYIEIKEEHDVKKKSPKDIYLERTQKSTSKSSFVETPKKTTEKVVEEKKPEEKVFKRVPSTSFNNTKSKKNFFEEKITIEAEKSKSTLKTNRSSDKFTPAGKTPSQHSPERDAPKAKSPTRHASPSNKSPVRQSPTRKSPEKVKRKYDGRKDSLMEIRGSNIIAERRTKFSPLKENQTEPVSRRAPKNVNAKENIKPSEKKSDRKSVERKSQERTVYTATVTTKTISNDITQDKISKDRKPSVERAAQRKPSSKFEERRASFENKSVTERKISSEKKYSERRISSDKTVTETRKKSKSPEPKNRDQSSPVRKVSKKSASPDHDAKPNQKQDSFNNKFGVALRKSSNTSTTNVTTAKSTTSNVLKSSNKNTTTDSIFDIESIFDLELLEKMLEKAVGYDQRRRLRAQIREVRRVQEEATSRKSTSPSRNTNQKRSFIEEKQKEFHTISSAAKTVQSVATTPKSGPSPTKKSTPSYEPKPAAIFDKSAPSSGEKRNSYQRNDTVETAVSRKGSTEYSQQSTYTTSQVREETCTDSITSSYGVGPTDENGRPLFGLKALKRANTNKALVDSSSHSTVVSSRTSMKTDSSGKVSVTRDTMAGEISVVDDEEPKGKLVKSEFKFNKTSAEDKGQSESKTTTAVLNARNIKDSQITESFRLTDHNGRNNFIENEKRGGSHRKTTDAKENQESGAGVEKRKKSDSNQTYKQSADEKRISKTDSSSSFSSKQVTESSEKRSYKKTDSSGSIKSSRQHAANEDDQGEVEVRRKPVVRGDSVRALQHKFQQATVSSSMKTAAPSSNESKAVATSNNQTSKTVSTSNGTTTTTTKSSSTRTETFSTVTKGSSYEDSEEEDSGDGVRQIIEEEDIGNSSAALVSRVEKQRVASSGSRTDSRHKLDLSDVDLISDESQLRILLDACSDYEGRRKIRARLRDVMAENNDSTTMGTRGVYLGDDSDEDDVKVVNDSGTESSEDQIENNRTVVDKHDKNENQDKALMTEVQITLARLENELNKTSNKDNVQGLMNKLKTFLNVKNVNENNQQLGQTIPTPPPRKYHKHRHSIAVSQNDMTVPDQHDHQDDRTVTVGKHNQPKIIINNTSNRQSDGQLKQAVNLNNNINKNKNVVHFQKDIIDSNRTNNDVGKQSIPKENSLEAQSRNHQFQKQSSLDSTDYSGSLISPRLVLSSEAARTENTNANVKPYNNTHYSPDVNSVESHGLDKPLVATLTLRENNQAMDDADADDGDISSDDDELGGNNIRNARKLMKFAKNEMKSKQLVRSSKKIKMKRSNTIDIPKNMKYYSSGDELATDDRLKTKTPTFIPKTENDFKFLAFLKRNNTEDTKSYNSAARGGAHWSNRFSCIKTTFENAEKQNGTPVEPKKSKAKLFWQKSEEKMYQNNRVPGKINEEDSTNVVTGSLVVQTKPTQNFTHASKSPFQAVNKIQSIPQTKTSFSGTVKQMANEKFNKAENVQNMGPRVVVGVKNPKISNIDQQLYNYENNNSQVRRPDKQNIFSPTNSINHSFIPEQTNFKPIPDKSDVPHTYKPVVQPVYPYQKPQVPNQVNHQPNQFVKKQFPEPQYQKPVPKVLSPQYGITAFKEHSMYVPPQDYHDKSRIFSPTQNNSAGFNENPANFQVQHNAQTGYYESQISPYEPSVVEIHKSPLCTKNGAHFTPISPAVVDTISYEPQTVAVSRVMGKEQCQQAVIVNKSDRQHFNESTNVLKNIISQHQNYDDHISLPPQNQLPDDGSSYPFITPDLPSNTSYVYPTPVPRTNVQSMSYTANSSVPQTFHNYPQSNNISSSYQSFTSPPTSSSNLHQTSQGTVQQHQYYPPPGQTNYHSIPQNSLYQTSNNASKTRPNSMYMQSDEYNNKVDFSNNPIYSSNNAPYALSGSKSSSAVYPSSLMSPVNYPYRNNSSNVPQERNYQSIPSNQFVDPRQRLVSNNVTSYERAISQPPSSKYNTAIVNNGAVNTPRANFKGPGGDTKMSYMNYISQISPQTMQSKLNYSPGRKSISPSGQNSQSYGELSQSSTQSSISENSPIKLISPHMNLSTPSSPHFPNPPILTKTPQLKISSKTAFVPVKPFNQNVASSSIPKQNLKLPPTSPHQTSYTISPSIGYLSPMSPSSSPKMPSVLQKSESWHQMVLDRMGPKKLSPIPVGPNKLLPKAKSSHSLSFAKQFEAAIPDTIEKKKTVEAYLKTDGNKKEINKYNFKQFKKTKTSKSSSSATKTVVPLSDNLDNVDEAFDSLFNSSK